MVVQHPAEVLTTTLIDAIGYRLPNVEYQTDDEKPSQTKRRRPDIKDVEIRMFPETREITAYTLIVSMKNIALVYWSGDFAYSVEPDEIFLSDVNGGSTADRSTAINRYKIILL